MLARANPLAAIALAALSAPALRAAPCGRVLVDGRGLPAGAIRLSAEDGSHSAARIKDGRFCLDALQPGRYSVEIEPLPSGAAFPLKEDRLDWRGGDGDLPAFEARPETPRQDWLLVKGTLDAIGGIGPGPVLVMISVKHGPRPQSLHFVWAERGRFTLPIAPGMIESVLAWTKGLAIAEVDPPLHVHRLSQETVLHPGQDYPLKVTLAPAGLLRIRTAGRFGRPARLRVERLGGGEKFIASLFEGDDIELPLAAGLWGIVGLLRPGSTDTLRGWPLDWLFIEPGRTAEIELRAPDEAVLSLAPRGVVLPPLPENSLRLYRNSARMIIAFPPGIAAADAFRFFLPDASAWSATRDDDGFWRPKDRDESPAGPGFSVPAGRFDVFVADIFRAGPPFAVIRALRRGFELRPGRAETFSLGAGDYVAAGGAELRGTLKASMKWNLKELGGMTASWRLAQAIVPTVSLVDAAGRLTAVASVLVPSRRVGEIFSALDRADREAVRADLYGGSGEFRVSGIAPGRYRAVIAAYGYPTREFSVELKDGKAARLDVDLDAP